MGILDYFRSEKKKTASLAKDRLQIIVAHQRNGNGNSMDADYLPKLKEELLKVISKYVEITPDKISVQLDTNDDCPILELNVTLPDRKKVL